MLNKGDTGERQYNVCLKKALTAGRPGREDVRDSPGLWRLSWEIMGESILEEPVNTHVVECCYDTENSLPAETVCEED